MPKLRYTGMIKKSGSSANETFATISSGEIISKAKSQKKPVLNAEQKANVSGFTELVPLTRDLKRVFRESFPPDSKGTKWSNRFTSLNKKSKEVVTTTIPTWRSTHGNTPPRNSPASSHGRSSSWRKARSGRPPWR